jgi:hypothetical protein
VFINTVGANAKVQTLVTRQMQLCIAASAKPKTAPIAALTFTNILCLSWCSTPAIAALRIREAKSFRENLTCIMHDRIESSIASTSSAILHDHIVKSG